MPKRDLVFSKRLMNAAGSLGFSPDPRALSELAGFDAFVTNPISLRPRRPTAAPALLPYSGGFLLHTGFPNPGFKSAVQRYRPAWERAHLPVIVHLMADRPDEARAMTRDLERLDCVLALELGFAPLLADDILSLAVEMCIGELPIIVNLPTDQVLRLGPRLIENGVAAISLAAPRGSLMHGGRLVSGRLFGPSLLPQTVSLVAAASSIGLAVIGAGGVYSKEAARSLLDAGAMAVQLDAGLWLPAAKEKGLVN